jgi:aminomuconate-semialdehyde/2-hydroxymuconate-6-semialdehyde dehydrogenase
MNTNDTIQIQNYSNGTYQNPQSNIWIDNYEPASGKIYGKIPNSNAQDIQEAVAFAKAAFPSWSQTTIDERSRILLKISDGIETRLQELAQAESRDNGKPISLAKSVDIPRAASNFRFFGNDITLFASESQ